MHDELKLSSNYEIRGYACNSDIGSEEELLALAERRAIKVKNYLVDKGFPSKQLFTVAFDKDLECKVVIIKMEE